MYISEPNVPVTFSWLCVQLQLTSFNIVLFFIRPPFYFVVAFSILTLAALFGSGYNLSEGTQCLRQVMSLSKSSSLIL